MDVKYVQEVHMRQKKVYTIVLGVNLALVQKMLEASNVNPVPGIGLWIIVGSIDALHVPLIVKVLQGQQNAMENCVILGLILIALNQLLENKKMIGNILMLLESSMYHVTMTVFYAKHGVIHFLSRNKF